MNAAKSLIFFAIIAVNTAQGQSIDHSSVSNMNRVEIPLDYIYSTSRRMVNAYKHALFGAGDCNFNPALYIQDNMMPTTVIEVVNRSTMKPIPYSAEKYFDALNRLFCSDAKKYDSVKFLFTTYPIDISNIVQDEYNHKMVHCKIGQSFRGYNAEGGYEDFTIKVITLVFSDVNGRGHPAFKARISKILVESIDGIPIKR